MDGQLGRCGEEERLGHWKCLGLFPCFVTVECEISRHDVFLSSLLLLVCHGIYQPAATLNGSITEEVV